MSLLLLLFYRRELLNLLRREGLFLVLFLLIAFGTSSLHFLQKSGGYRDFAVSSYMALLYVYFRIVQFSSRQKLILGGGILFFLWGLWASGHLFPGVLRDHFFYIEQKFTFEGAGFLNLRFAALFRNPNILGFSFPFPLLLLSEWWSRRYETGRWPVRLMLLAGAFLVCLPLFSSASKHFIISYAVILASWFRVLRLPRAGWLFHGGYLSVVVLGLICWCTVLVLTFPLKNHFPWVNTDCQSNYSLHQEIYLRMGGHDWRGLLLGRGIQEIRRLYPEYADRDKTAMVLKRYHGEHLTELFVTFMDPHNEYLNLLTFFGIAGLAAMVCFLGGIQIRSFRERKFLMFYFMTALMMCCLWDDLLSKRFIWMELALVVSMSVHGSSRSADSVDLCAAADDSIFSEKRRI